MTISSCLNTYDKALKDNPDAGRFFILTEAFSTRAEYFRRSFVNKAWNSLCPVLDTALIMVLLKDCGGLSNQRCIMYKITDEVSLRSAIDKYIKFYAEERLQERFHCKTPLEVRSEALSAEAPTQYPNTQGGSCLQHKSGRVSSCIFIRWTYLNG